MPRISLLSNRILAQPIMWKNQLPLPSGERVGVRGHPGENTAISWAFRSAHRMP
jgi:hypothetical protein